MKTFSVVLSLGCSAWLDRSDKSYHIYLTLNSVTVRYKAPQRLNWLFSATQYMITQRVNDINSYSDHVYPFLIILVYFMQLKYRRSHDEETPSLLWMHFHVQIWGDVQGDLGSFEDCWVGEAAVLLNGLASQVAPLEGMQCWNWSGTRKINTQVQYFTFLQWITVIAGRHIFLCALFLKSSMQSSIKQRELFF